MPPSSRLALALATLAFFAWDATGEEPTWHRAPLPGGVAGLCRAAGLDPCVEPWRVLYETSRRLYPTYGDPADAARLGERVRAHLQAPPGDGGSLSTDSVLVPLSPGLWRRAFLGHSVTDDRLIGAMLGDRASALMYRGLFQLDEATLGFLTEHPDLLSWIKENRPEAFSVFAGSLRIQGGRVEAPGGGEADALWRAVVDESPARPGRFLRKLLAREEGRQAFFFHTLHHLEPAALRFALGPAGPDPERRRERFRALADVFGRTPVWWRPEAGAFARPLVDPAVVLRLVKVGEDGRPTAPAGRAFWEAAFAVPAPTAGERARLSRDVPFDAAWIAEQVGLAATPELRRERLTELALAQRVFAGAAPGDLADVLLTARGLARYPALVLVLDRMDARNPAVYAQAVRRAESLPSQGEDRRGRATLGQFQAALAILDRARFARALEAPEAESLVASLCAVPVEGERYSGAIAAWMEDRLLPALARGAGGDPSSLPAEDLVLAAMAGERLAAREPPPLEWEGSWYRASPGAAEGRRLRLIRERQGGSTLDAVLAFSRAARPLAPSPETGGLERLREAAGRLAPESLPPEATRELEARGSGGPGRARALLEAAEDLMAETLASLAYAPHLGAAHGAALAGANVAKRHELSRRPWALPEEVLGSGPWRVRGSLLGLDLALARLSLRRLTGDMPARAPGLDPATALGFARSVALLSPFALHDDEMRQIAEAISRGRVRVAGVRGASDAKELARAAGLEAWRTPGLSSTLESAAGGRTAFFTLPELLRLGGPAPPPGEAWGTPDRARGGSLRLLPPPPGGKDDLLGQRLEDLHAARASDLVLRVAAELHSRHLPASLVPGVMGLFVQDLVQEATPLSHDDWLAIARFAQQAPPERFDEYVSALAGEGPLLPAPEPEPGEASTR